MIVSLIVCILRVLLHVDRDGSQSAWDDRSNPCGCLIASYLLHDKHALLCLTLQFVKSGLGVMYGGLLPGESFVEIFGLLKAISSLDELFS